MISFLYVHIEQQCKCYFLYSQHLYEAHHLREEIQELLLDGRNMFFFGKLKSTPQPSSCITCGLVKYLDLLNDSPISYKTQRIKDKQRWKQTMKVYFKCIYRWIQETERLAFCDITFLLKLTATNMVDKNDIIMELKHFCFSQQNKLVKVFSSNYHCLAPTPWGDW